MNQQLASIDQIRNTVIDLAIRFGPKVLVALLILTVGLFVSRGISRATLRALHRIELEPPVRTLLARVAWVVCFALFFIMALQNLGVELLPLIAGLSVVGAGLALATQGVLSNVVAGLSIIFSKPFRVGEYISIVEKEGVVHTITLFSTTLMHADHSRVVIPNRKIVGEILHNYGQIRQIAITVGVAYDTNINDALAAIGAVLEANPRILKTPPPVVQTSMLGEWSVAIAVRPWVSVQDYGAAVGEINKAILETLREKGIVLPFPQQEVRYLNAPA